MNVYPGMIPELDITLDTPEWFDWLSSANQFKYVGNLTEMSVKRRAANGKWYARKKVYSSNGGSKPVDLYIGSDSECTAEKLREINFHFAKDWVAFWQWYHSPSRKQGKGKGVQMPEVYTEEVTTSQTQNEIAQLRAAIDELREKNLQLKKQLAEAEDKYINIHEAGAIALEDYLNELGGIPLDDKGKPKARYDQLSKFKAWLEGR